jgi:hypothetical protein
VNFRSLHLIVLAHGLVTFVFALVFLLEAFEIAVTLISLEAQRSNFLPLVYSKAKCLFAAVGIINFCILRSTFFLLIFKKI